ncbi:MAG: SDR family oxidoreductase [Deltaproteobacteria bacterium]|nr:SDR family oxidoreductase [Deltaproteobacteria bacterium]
MTRDSFRQGSLASPGLPASPLSVSGTLSGKQLFVTGTTGFLGKVLVAHLLDSVPDIGRLHLLVRAGKSRTGPVGAPERFRHIVLRSPAFRPLRARHGEHLEAWLADKVRLWEGDVTDVDCGLGGADVAELAPAIDAVIHVAGLTDFEPDPKKALEVNVRGAMHVLDLASKLERAVLVHTSTCYAAGERSGRILEALPTATPSGVPLDPEAELAQLTAIAERPTHHDPELKKEKQKAGTARAKLMGFPNTYTYSKALAEHLLSARAPTNGTRRPVPLTIVRPAIIECARTFPFEGWNEGINTTGPLMWLISSWFRHLPSKPGNHFDVVPVDTCTRSMIAITAAAIAGRAKKIYQIGTSSSNPFTIGRAIELNNLAVRKDLGASSRPKLERWVQRFMDTVPVSAEVDHAWSPKRLRGIAKEVKGLVHGLGASKLPPAVSRGRETAEMLLDDVDKTLGRVQRMLDLYRPFIHDHDWIFDNRELRALDGELDAPSRAAFGWDGDTIDWRRYWIDVLYPGLNTWCTPLLEGGTVPDDPMPAWAKDSHRQRAPRAVVSTIVSEAVATLSEPTTFAADPAPVDEGVAG